MSVREYSVYVTEDSMLYMRLACCIHLCIYVAECSICVSPALHIYMYISMCI